MSEGIRDAHEHGGTAEQCETSLDHRSEGAQSADTAHAGTKCEAARPTDTRHRPGREYRRSSGTDDEQRYGQRGERRHRRHAMSNDSAQGDYGHGSRHRRCLRNGQNRDIRVEKFSRSQN